MLGEFQWPSTFVMTDKPTRSLSNRIVTADESISELRRAGVIIYLPSGKGYEDLILGETTKSYGLSYPGTRDPQLIS